MGAPPYVAVWIEDKDRFPVRTVASGTTASPATSRNSEPGLAATASRHGGGVANRRHRHERDARRREVHLQWDGKDNAGKPVRAGTYTVCIEASREHGTYQIIRQDMDFSGTAKHVVLPGGTEISAATLDYQQVGH